MFWQQKVAIKNIFYQRNWNIFSFEISQVYKSLGLGGYVGFFTLL